MSGARHNRPAGPPPDAAELHDAALDYLARYAATEAGLRRVLERRVERWAQRAAATASPDAVAARATESRSAVADVVARLSAAGAVNDTAYAESRGKSLLRAGRSRRAAAAQLAAKGVDPATLQSVLPADPDTELAAALVLARKRRIGPFRTAAANPHRELGILARAGFQQDLARRALAMDPDTAETLVQQFRR